MTNTDTEVSEMSQSHLNRLVFTAQLATVKLFGNNTCCLATH